MINLLPDTTKKEIRAGRLNVILLRYNMFALIFAGLLVVTCVIFYFILSSSESAALGRSNDNSSKAASYEDVRKAAEEYRSNLTIASQVLNKGVNYTSVIFEITKLLPNGVILDGINLNAVDFGKQISFTAHAKTYAQATQIKENFQNSRLFTNVYFQSISDGSSVVTQGNNSYPITVTISAKLNEVSTQ